MSEVIPAEAVEAAAKAWAGGIDAAWEYLPPLARATALTRAKRAFEAAAPYLQKEAWDRGYADCTSDIFRDSELVKRGSRLDEGTPNPYQQ